jgi:hypothetical protein
MNGCIDLFIFFNKYRDGDGKWGETCALFCLIRINPTSFNAAQKRKRDDLA